MYFYRALVQPGADTQKTEIVYTGITNETDFDIRFKRILIKVSNSLVSQWAVGTANIAFSCGIQNVFNADYTFAIPLSAAGRVSLLIQPEWVVIPAEWEPLQSAETFTFYLQSTNTGVANQATIFAEYERVVRQ